MPGLRRKQLMDLTPEVFVTLLEKNLAAWCKPSHARCITPDDWRVGGGMRTHIMKGNAIRRRRAATPNYVLRDVLEAGGYERWEPRRRDLRRVYFPERHTLDVVAIDCPSNWDDDCHRGQYRTTLAIELENDLREFEMTMRGLLDVRASLSCGIFYARDGREPREVGVAHAHDPGPQWAPLDAWRPSWFNKGWPVPPLPGERQLAIFLSELEPRVVGARCYAPDGSAVRLRGD